MRRASILLLSVALISSVMPGQAFPAGTVDGSVNPDQIPDKVAFNYFSPLSPNLRKTCRQV